MRFLLATLAILLGLLPNLALADCAAATAPLDKLTCDTPDIAAKDRALNDKYRVAMALLPEAGKRRLRDGERKWLAWVRAACAFSPGSQSDPLDDRAKDCLRREYDERLAQLDGAALRIGPYLLSRIDDYAFKRRAGDKYGGFHTRFYSRPYIDHPSTPQTDAWNQMVTDLADRTESELRSEHLEFDDPMRILDQGEMRVDYTLGLGSQDFLSVAIHAFAHEDGGFTPGWGRTLTSAWLLQPAREMTISEIFKPGTEWEATLHTECDAAIKDGRWPEDISCDYGGPEWSWIPSTNGAVLFVFVDVDPYATIGSGIPVELKWANLRSLLRTELPFAVPPQ